MRVTAPLDVLLTGGQVIDGTGNPWFRADVGIRDGKIVAIGRLHGASAALELDATGKIVAPGFVDAHVHGDLALLADPLHEPAIRQGVTTYILGQDGVALAPGSPDTLAFMARYTAGFSGGADWLAEHGPPSWSSFADYLALFDNRCAVNVACLVPNGNVRMEILGLDPRAPTADELERMGALVRECMEQGAVGLSSGLDYIPSRYAGVDELAGLCRFMAPHEGVYVTHMRRYDPAGVLESMDEVYRIGQEGGVPVHISHFNSRADLVLPKLDAGRRAGVDVTFDLYCYLAGSSILGMYTLPPWVQAGGIDATVTRLRDPAVRERLREWFADPPRGPFEDIRLSYAASPAYRRHEGQTLGQAARERGVALGDFVCDVLVASGMAAGCVAPHRQRDEGDVEALIRHPAMMGGSDGIFTGTCPHPRGCGCFARYLGYHVRERHTWSLETAVQRLAAHPARRFGLADRGLLRPGLAADVVVFDPDTIADQATYDEGRRLAVGMEHVLVNGIPVLREGRRTAALPGRSLRRA